MVSTIAEWLKSHGMSEYAERFAENRIDVSVLKHLSDQDLKDLGVVALGDRRKLLHAISGLSVSAPEGPPPSATTAPAGNEGAERRQLTVMFTDLVGSTALSTKLDPEDLRSVIGMYHTCVADTVTRFDGFVAKYMGDGVLVYFGYPQAHEDDVERAVRSGLALVEAVRSLTAPERLHVRIGVGTGLVVVGDLIGSGEAQERGIVGETPNLAARLQAAAAPGAIVIDPTTRRLLAGLFEYRDLGRIEVRGFATPVQAYEVVRSRTVESRFEALRAATLTALIGREEESDLLRRRWSSAKLGEGQVVLISGEAGIGKSRLTAAFLERLAAEPHTRLRYFCSPQHTDSPLYPIIGQMERAAGLTHDETPQLKLEKLTAVLAQTSTSTHDAALFAEMLSIPTNGRYHALELAPQQRRQRTLEALVSQIEVLTQQKPVLMIFEDAHWIDPTSLEVLGRVVDRIHPLRVLLIVTFRPEFDPPWIGQPHVTALTINRLAQREVTAMIDRVIGNKPLPASIRQDIIERTDGIPLFVEEMTKAVLEAESEDEARRTAAAIPSPALAVPVSLHASLMARLDRLGTAAKEVAQVGAAIGREFSYELLSAIMSQNQSNLQTSTDRLVHSGLMFQRGTPPHSSYTFKHALVQDSAYGMLLRRKRTELHARIAEVLEGRFPEVGELQPEVLAHHSTEGRLTERAVAYWRRAGERASERSANREAIKHLTTGLDLLRSLPETPQRQKEELALWMASAVPLLAMKGYAAREVETAYGAANDLCDRLGQSPEKFPVLRGLWNCHLLRGELLRAHALAEQLVALADMEGDPLRRALSRRASGTSLLYLGQFVEASRQLDQGIEIDDAAVAAAGCGSPRLFLYGESAGVVCRLYSAWDFWFLGFPDRAVERVEAGLALARQLSHAHVLAFALSFATVIYLFRRDYAAALRRAEEAITLSTDHGFTQWRFFGTMCRGRARAGLGQHMDGIAELCTGLAGWERIGARLSATKWLGFAADAHAEAGQVNEALVALERATETAAFTAEQFYKAELYRLRAELLLVLSDQASAEEQLHKAVAIAREQSAKSLELRATTSLARLWHDQGKRTEARDLLAPIYNWFTEGFDTPVLQEAKALLTDLA